MSRRCRNGFKDRAWRSCSTCRSPTPCGSEPMGARWFFCAALLVGLVAGSASHADEPPGRVFRIGIVSALARSWIDEVTFEDRLRELGYVEGRNLTIDFVQDSDMDRRAAAIGEIALRGVDVIVVGGRDAELRAAIAASCSTPVVFRAVESDPLAKGYITGLAHPGGNATGVVFQQPELIAKRLDLLRQA